MISKITFLLADDPILRTSCLAVDKKVLRSKAFQTQLDQLVNYIYGVSNKGQQRNTSKPMTAGLSANQVGLTYQISLVDLAIGHKGFSDIHILINPQIIWHDQALQDRYEGCLNLPHVYGFVKRFQKIKVTAWDRSSNEITLSLSGWPAILLQHEIGHLHGELFIDRLPDPVHAHWVNDGEYKQYKKLKKNWPNFVDISHLVKK